MAERAYIGPVEIDWTPANIRALRYYLGETLATFAVRCGVSRRATVAEWERGSVTPSDTTRRLFDYIAADAGLTPGKLPQVAERMNAEQGRE